MSKKETKKPKIPNDKGFEKFTLIHPDVSYWNPTEPGEEIEGIYSEKYKGTKHTRFILTLKDNKRRILPDALYIRELFKEEKIKIGDRLKVRYLSKKITERGTKIYGYTVGVIQKEGGSND